MKLNRTTLVLPLAGLLVVAGAGAAFATPGDPGSSANAVVPAATSPSPSAGTTAGPKGDRDTILADVLANLVDDGTITDTQRTAILDALAAERNERQAAREAARTQLQQFLADGIITQAEIDQLPADSPLRTLTTLLDDGQITTDELQGLGHGFGLFGGRGGHGHGRFGGDFFGEGGPAAPDETPAPSTGTDG